MALDDLRTRIDAIDDAILELLEQRADVARAIAVAKKHVGRPTYDPERERQVLERLSARAEGKFPLEAIRSVYREVMSACLSLQEPVVVAYLGPEGTYSHQAAREVFGLSVRYLEAGIISGVVDAVARGEANFGIVPVENSTEGSVASATDALLETEVHIRSEHVLPVAHCLLSRAAQIASIARIYSHPQALAQCRDWIGANAPGAQLMQTSSTSAAAREATTDPAGAAIGSRLLADLYGLPILREKIQDREDNATRFLVLANEDAPPTGDDRTTLVFALRDAPGALLRALDVFGRAEVSLTRIESRPSRKRAWEYLFLADLAGHRADAAVAQALVELETQCASLRIIGSYPRAARV